MGELTRNSLFDIVFLETTCSEALFGIKEENVQRLRSEQHEQQFSHERPPILTVQKKVCKFSLKLNLEALLLWN